MAARKGEIESEINLLLWFDYISGQMDDPDGDKLIGTKQRKYIPAFDVTALGWARAEIAIVAWISAILTLPRANRNI